MVVLTTVVDHGSSVIVRLMNVSLRSVVREERSARVSLEDEDDAHIRNIYDQVDLVVSVKDLGRLKSSMHGIKTDRSEPIRQRLSPQPLTVIPAIDQHLDKMLEQGLIELFRSE